MTSSLCNGLQFARKSQRESRKTPANGGGGIRTLVGGISPETVFAPAVSPMSMGGFEAVGKELGKAGLNSWAGLQRRRSSADLSGGMLSRPADLDTSPKSNLAAGWYGEGGLPAA
jgi:hypothetical protein